MKPLLATVCFSFSLMSMGLSANPNKVVTVDINNPQAVEEGLKITGQIKTIAQSFQDIESNRIQANSTLMQSLEKCQINTACTVESLRSAAKNFNQLASKLKESSDQASKLAGEGFYKFDQYLKSKAEHLKAAGEARNRKLSSALEQLETEGLHRVSINDLDETAQRSLITIDGIAARAANAYQLEALQIDALASQQADIGKVKAFWQSSSMLSQVNYEKLLTFSNQLNGLAEKAITLGLASAFTRDVNNVSKQMTKQGKITNTDLSGLIAADVVDKLTDDLQLASPELALEGIASFLHMNAALTQ